MGKTLIALCVLVTACQPMYGGGTPPPRNPTPVKPTEDKTAEQKPEYVDRCTVDFTAPPTKKRQTASADHLVTQGDTALATAKPEKTVTPTKVNNMTRAVDYYSDALRKDPYHADATLKLALAYDEILRKGCAIAMLKRLYALTENPTFHADAKITLVVDNTHWFSGYRQEALRAIGK